MDPIRDTINAVIALQSPENEACEVSEYIHCALFMVARSHMWHLQTKSYAQHKALNKFYDKLQCYVDRLAEAAIGEKGPLKATEQTFTFDCPDNAINGIDEFYHQTDELYETLQDMPSLTVTLEEILALCKQTKYKLVYLH